MWERQVEWGKKFANDMTNKWLISKIYKRARTTQYQKQTKSVKIWSFGKDIQMH